MEGLQSGNDPSLPPLMNPTMLEASDDLTNLSHLNEPAGRSTPSLLGCWHTHKMLTSLAPTSPAGHPPPIPPERNIHILRYRANSDQPLRSGRLALRSGHGAGICREAEGYTSAPSFCHCRGGLYVWFCADHWLWIPAGLGAVADHSAGTCCEMARTKLWLSPVSPVPARLSAPSTL